MDDPVKKQAYKQTIYTKYTNETSDTEVVSNLKKKAFQGKFIK
jgi:hypothetical protein